MRRRALTATSIEELEAIYRSFSGTGFNAPLFSSVVGGLNFSGGLFSCAVGEGQFAAIDEGQCGWTRISGSTFDRDDTSNTPGLREDVFSLAVGGQIALDENIRLGASLGYDAVNSNGNDGVDFDADRIHAGVSAKFVEGPFVAGVAAKVGVSFTDTERSITGANAVATGDTRIVDFSVVARAAYQFEPTENFYVKPQVQAGVTFVSRDSFTEKGAGAFNLDVDGKSKTYLSFAPSIEVGGEFELEDVTVRPYARVGALFLSEDAIKTTARFANSGSNQSFTSTAMRDDVFVDVAVGAVLFTQDDVSVRAEYNGRFSQNSEQHGGFVRLQVDF